MLPDSRACTKCGLDKPLPEFSKAPRGKYGRKASCKTCDAARHKAQFVPRPQDEVAREARYTRQRSESKICTKCGQAKPRSEFTKSRDGKYGPVLHASCNECKAQRARSWFADNPERQFEARRRSSLLRNYGITVGEYEDRLEAQGGVCAICGQDEPAVHGRTGKKFRLSVDHCHQTGRVRGLLCQKCNRAIGLMNDNADLLKKAIYYLERE